MTEVVDLFSQRAKVYSKFRPTYPKVLYDFIYSHLAHLDKAWDCGTGNGQVASELAKKFKHIYATDLSAAQLAEAREEHNISYSLQRAEVTDFADHEMDLTCVAQAIHWFDLEAFWKEVKRVSKPKGFVAIWGYDLLKISKEIDTLIFNFYENILGEYWDQNRRLVENSYADMACPLDEIKTPEFEMRVEWSLDQLTGYLSSWSAVTKYQNLNKQNPIDLIEEELSKLWGKESRSITFPIFSRMGRIQ